MRRLFLLAKDDQMARDLIAKLKAEAPLVGDIKLIGGAAGMADELGVEEAGPDEFSGIRMARRRAGLLGALMGGGFSLLGLFAPEGSLPLSPVLAITLATIGGGALGTVIGALVGSAEGHPIYDLHASDLSSGASLIVLETHAHDLDAVVAVTKTVDSKIPIEARTLTDQIVHLE